MARTPSTEGPAYAPRHHIGHHSRNDLGAATCNVSSGNIYYYEEDMLGSSRTMVQAGQTSVCFDADFLPFGYEKDVVNTCTQNYKFEGKERDTETANDDFGARYYTFRLGRWLSADWSSVPAPVPYANLTNPQTLNLYAMVSDNPESFADLTGHCGSGGLPGASSSTQGCADPPNGPATTGEGFDPLNENSGIADWYLGEVSAERTERAAQEQAKKNANKEKQKQKPVNPGVPVVLPNGSTVPDSHSPTGVLMSPVADLSPVAAAGNNTFQNYLILLGIGETTANIYMDASLGTNVGTGGTFDYQRSGDAITGFEQLPQFRDVSNFNVGLFSAKAGLSLEETLTTAGRYAKHFSSNANKDQPYGLAPRTAEFIRARYGAAADYQ